MAQSCLLRKKTHEPRYEISQHFHTNSNHHRTKKFFSVVVQILVRNIACMRLPEIKDLVRDMLLNEIIPFACIGLGDRLPYV